MNTSVIKNRSFIVRLPCLLLVIWAGVAGAQPAADSANVVQMVELQGTVETAPAGATTWTVARTNQIFHAFDRLRTGANSRMALRWSGQSVIAFGASTELEVLPPSAPQDQSGLHLVRGVLSFFHRDQPGRIKIITRGAVAGVEGTEFLVAVNDADRTTLSVVDGKVAFGNEQATLTLTNGEQALVDVGQTPVRTAGFIANNLLQWCFYYPAVLNPDDLALTAEEKTTLGTSLAAYRAGDLLAALQNYPAATAPVSEAGKIYHAGLLLSVGQVDACETQLGSIQSPPAEALRELIMAMKFQRRPAAINGTNSTTLLADSYYEQSRAKRETSLAAALKLARASANAAPDFGFAWARVAELEFSFGRTREALEALDKSLALAPRNAQTLALKGFIAAKNQPRDAIHWFDQAIAADAALGNAWLGRGLARIHQGDTQGGREDLLVAAALEPQRAELRSYLGKAYTTAGDSPHAAAELTLAKKLDPKDPTAWLYSALLNQQNNQINDAIRDLEKSQALNDNRSVYRSQLLLDQDRAVRSANLAGVYRDAGLFDLSLREAGRAVSSDYANYSAHLFLANSYDQLRDPNWSNLRYETPASDEYWIANLLAPTAAGWLTPLTSEQPRTKLFEQSRFGFASDTTYLSRGAWTEKAEQFYTSGNFSYNVGVSHQYDPGQRPNNDFENQELNITLKGQLTSQDSLFGGVQLAKIDYGDNNQYYDQAYANPTFRLSEKQEPNLYLGYHREWSPGVHTLFFATRQVAEETGTALNAPQTIGFIYQGVLNAERYMAADETVKLAPELYSTELQQIWETANHATMVGARYQWGDVHDQNTGTFAGGIWPALLVEDGYTVPPQDFTLNFHQFTVYGYHNWQLTDTFALNVGLSYDQLYQPLDLASTPFTTQEKTTSLLSPKIGLIWTPRINTTIRAAYTRSLSGFAQGQSLRLEPTEIAGFNQAFRSLIPESVAGETSGSQFDTYDLSLEQKFDTGTYLGLAGEFLCSQRDGVQGAYIYNGDQSDTNLYPTYTTGLRQSMKYQEASLTFTVDQLLGQQWTAGARYRVSQAKLDSSYVDFPANLPAINVDPGFQPRQSVESILHTVNLHANWNHPSGLFCVLEGNWYHQHNAGFYSAAPGDDFCQFNAFAGYRFWQRRAELTAGLLNIFDQNYSLEPLNLHNEMARSRTFLARLKISF